MCCQDAKGCLLLSLSKWTCAGCIAPSFPPWKAFEAGSMCALDERLGGDRLASRRPLGSAQNFGSANCHVRSKTTLLLGLLHAEIENSLNRTKMLDAACCTAQIPLIIAFPSHSTTKWPCHIAINPPKPTSKTQISMPSESVQLRSRPCWPRAVRLVKPSAATASRKT